MDRGGESLACAVEGCTRTRRRRKALYCEAHYHRLYRTGSLGLEPIRTGPQFCRLVGCEEKHYGQGMCSKHWQRWRKWGDPTIVNSSLPGSGSWNWTGDDVGYHGAHIRLRRALGPASARACVDCDGPALHWSYDHTDSNPRYEMVDGFLLPYSTDPSRYQPRCVGCHKILDLNR